MSSATVQARLDQRSKTALDALVKRLGWSPSKVVREALHLLAASQLGGGRREILGLGRFASGISDLGSNKSHLKDFGR